jgi:hypothetical protein
MAIMTMHNIDASDCIDNGYKCDVESAQLYRILKEGIREHDRGTKNSNNNTEEVKLPEPDLVGYGDGDFLWQVIIFFSSNTTVKSLFISFFTFLLDTSPAIERCLFDDCSLSLSLLATAQMLK